MQLSRGRRYQSPGVRLFFTTFAILGPALALMLISRESSEGASTTTRLVVLIVGFIWLPVGFRCAASSIIATTNGIRVVNPWSTQSLRWDEVETFCLGRWGILPRNCIVMLRDGRTVGVFGIAARNPNIFKNDAKTDQIIDQLNVELRSRGIA